MYEENTYVSMYSRNAELYHHGIKGQKWGVQNGPPYPLDKETSKRIKNMNKRAKKARVTKDDEYAALTLPKGTKVYRYALPNEDISKKKALYVGFLKNDEKNIKAIIPWMADRQNANKDEFVKYEYTANKDIKIAPIKETLDIQRQALKDPKMRMAVATYTTEMIVERSYGMPIGSASNKAMTKANVQLYDSYLKDYGSTPYKEISQYKDSYNYASERTANRYSNMAVGGVDQYKTYLTKELAKRGYNAMYDNAMIGYKSSNTKEAEAPIIILDTKAVDSNGSTKLKQGELFKSSYYNNIYVNNQRITKSKEVAKDLRQINKNNKT